MIYLHILRHLAQKRLVGRQPNCVVFTQSDEKSDCASHTQSMCGITFRRGNLIDKKTIYGRVHSVETFGAVDGPGIRYVLFVQGCGLRCLYCHNPDTWAMDSGSVRSSEEVIEDVKNYFNFIKGGGITISGGEPLLQPEFTLDIIRRAKALGLHTAIDTAGSVDLRNVQEIIEEADLLLLDIKTSDKELIKTLVGTTLDCSLAILAERERLKKPVWIRHVIVPGYTSRDDRNHMFAELLSGYSCIERVELLPFHKMGEFKWEELGYQYKLTDVPIPTRREMEAAAEPLRQKGLNVVVK